MMLLRLLLLVVVVVLVLVMVGLVLGLVLVLVLVLLLVLVLFLLPVLVLLLLVPLLRWCECRWQWRRRRQRWQRRPRRPSLLVVPGPYLLARRRRQHAPRRLVASLTLGLRPQQRRLPLRLRRDPVCVAACVFARRLAEAPAVAHQQYVHTTRQQPSQPRTSPSLPPATASPPG